MMHMWPVGLLGLFVPTWSTECLRYQKPIMCCAHLTHLCLLAQAAQMVKILVLTLMTKNQTRVHNLAASIIGMSDSESVVSRLVLLLSASLAKLGSKWEKRQISASNLYIVFVELVATWPWATWEHRCSYTEPKYVTGQNLSILSNTNTLRD